MAGKHQKHQNFPLYGILSVGSSGLFSKVKIFTNLLISMEKIFMTPSDKFLVHISRVKFSRMAIDSFSLEKCAIQFF